MLTLACSSEYSVAVAAIMAVDSGYDYICTVGDDWKPADYESFPVATRVRVML